MTILHTGAPVLGNIINKPEQGQNESPFIDSKLQWTSPLATSALATTDFCRSDISHSFALYKEELQDLAGKGAFVYKLGGSVTGQEAEDLSNPKQIAIWRQFAAELIFLLESNNGQDPIVVVHGGGKAIDAELTRQGITPQKIDGRRVTDPFTMEVVETVLSKQINRSLVSVINEVAGYEAAIGLSGSEVLSAYKTTRNEGRYGLVGEVESVNIKEIMAHLGKIVVVSPTAKNSDLEGVRAGAYGSSYLNINGDDAAKSVAEALHLAHGVQSFIAATDVPGVKTSGSHVLPILSRDRAIDLINQQIINGGMLPKVESSFQLVELGIPLVRFVEGTAPEAIVLGVLEASSVGTRLTA